jgi:membrane protein DedA with SNARE-associated domain
MEWEAQDVIALFLIVGGLSLMAMHIDGIVGGIVTMVTSYYFGHKLGHKAGKESKK